LSSGGDLSVAPKGQEAGKGKMNAAQNRPAKRTVGEVVKDIILFLAAPFISLFYVILFPFIGAAMLFRSLRADRAKPSAPN
jgi:hypothetical protein